MIGRSYPAGRPRLREKSSMRFSINCSSVCVNEDVAADRDDSRRRRLACRLPITRQGGAARIALVVAATWLVSPAVVLAQFNPGPNPITATVNLAQTLSTGTGTTNPGRNITIPTH